MSEINIITLLKIYEIIPYQKLLKLQSGFFPGMVLEIGFFNVFFIKVSVYFSG